MNGLIVLHRTYGYGKVVELASTGVRVQFCGSNQIVTFGTHAFQSRDVKHARLVLDTPVRSPRGLCVITSVPSPSTPDDAEFTYGVEYEDGLTDRVSEVELLPLVTVDQVSPAGHLSSFTPQPLSKVVAREKFVDAVALLTSQAGGLRALLSSRVDLHPHQAYVAGTVILDPQRRYILADEVGLGKTIEAGVVIHDRLMQKPHARVLVLTPGSLCRQWLCELHSSFGGQGFRLLDLHEQDAIERAAWPRVICSTNFALQWLTHWIEVQPWDMVVVDEVHHLLSSECLYSLVENLSKKVTDLLLLSALPARSREDEFLKLLRLLDPRRYGPRRAISTQFSELYGSQATISRRVNRLAIEIRDYTAGDASADNVMDLIDNLLSLPILTEDMDLRALAAEARTDKTRTAQIGGTICAEVIDRYRIHRRILRNRRSRLVEEHLLPAVRRSVVVHPYIPSQVESDANDATLRLLETAASHGCRTDLLRPLSRVLLGGLASAASLARFLRAFRSVQADRLNAKAIELINLAGTAGYDSWSLIEQLISVGAKPFVPLPVIDDALRATDRWIKSVTVPTRIVKLTEVLDAMRLKKKIIVFAGLAGLADETAAILEERYGASEVGIFTNALSDAEKEESARKFRLEERRWLLVCDETGGEGRNFQFVDELIHLDMPWAVSAIEQRIGRLDRLGRTADVISRVICNSTSLEAAWCACLDEGFGVFRQSISGVEFSLREQQDDALDAAINGIDALLARVPQIAAATTQERAADDANALVDEASNRGLSAFRCSGKSSADVDQQVQEGFIDFFRILASRGSLRNISDQRTPAGLWTVRPDEVRNVILKGLERDDGGLLPEHLGTFDRAVARSRRDVEFFCFGNRLFDAIVDVATTRPVGRSFAVVAAAKELMPVAFFELQIYAEPDLSAISQDSGLVNRARLVVDRRRTSFLFRLGTLEPMFHEPYEQAVSAIRSGRSAARDLGPEQVALLASQAGVDWAAHVKAACAAAIDAGKHRLAPRITSAIAREERTVVEQRRRCAIAGPDLEQEVHRLDLLLRSLERWEVRVDTVGLMSMV